MGDHLKKVIGRGASPSLIPKKNGQHVSAARAKIMYRKYNMAASKRRMNEAGDVVAGFEPANVRVKV